MLHPPYKVNYSLCIPNVYTIFYEHYACSFSAIKEFHDFWECVYIISGGLRVVVDSRIYDLAKNDLIIYNPLETHTFTITDENGADILIFSFDAYGDILDYLAGKAFHLSRHSVETADKIVECIHNNEKNLSGTELLTRVPDYMMKNRSFRDTIMTNIFMLLFSASKDEPVSPLSSTASAAMFSELAACMEKNIDKNISIDELSHICGISPTYIQNVFRKYTGMSAHKYYITLKMNTALKHLNNGMSVTEIADRLGFSSQAHFTKVFKKEIGCSPTSYRRSSLHD